MVDTRCCVEDHKTLKGFIEHYLNVHGGVVPRHEDPWPDHDHRHFRCCGQFHHGEAEFRKHIAKAHADVSPDEIRELSRELLGIEPEMEDEEPEDEPEAEGDDEGEDAEADEEDEGDDGDGERKSVEIDESKLEGLSGKERAIKKAKLIAEKKKQD